MLRRLIEWFGSAVGGDDAGRRDDGDRSRFVPSVLDASVRYAHGQKDGNIDRELARIDEEARRRERNLRRR